ncbi:MAG: acetyl-coenzyme A synthetase N-terminal domain-containing protein, partial [Flavobacteriia bacterium]
MNDSYQLRTLEQYQAAYEQSIQDPETFWAAIAENFTWQKKWDKVLDWNFEEPKVEWFKGAQLN